MGITRPPAQLQGDDGCKVEDDLENWKDDTTSPEEEPILISAIAPTKSRRQVAVRGCLAAVASALVGVLVCAALARASGTRPLRGASDGGAASAEKMAVKSPPHDFCNGQQHRYCSAEAFMSSPELHKLVASNIEEAGLVLRLHDDEGRRATVLETVRNTFANISAQLEERAPEMARAAREMHLEKADREGMMDLLELMNRWDVQSIGRYVAKLIHESPEQSPAELPRYLRSGIKPRLHEIQEVRNRLVPASVRQLWGNGHPDVVPTLRASQLAATVDLYNIRGIRAPGAILGSAGAAAMLSELHGGHSDEKRVSFAVFAGALEEGRMLLDILQLRLRLAAAAGHKKSHGAAELRGALDFGYSALTWPCQLDVSEATEVDAMKEVFCKLKFGAMGVDMLRSTLIDDMADSAGSG